MRPDELRTDPAELRPELGEVRRLVSAHDWAALEAVLGEEDDPDVLGPAMDVVVGTRGPTGSSATPRPPTPTRRWPARSWPSG